MDQAITPTISIFLTVVTITLDRILDLGLILDRIPGLDRTLGLDRILDRILDHLTGPLELDRDQVLLQVIARDQVQVHHPVGIVVPVIAAATEVVTENKLHQRLVKSAAYVGARSVR
jgi:hypothetical protein